MRRKLVYIFAILTLFLSTSAVNAQDLEFLLFHSGVILKEIALKTDVPFFGHKELSPGEIHVKGKDLPGGCIPLSDIEMEKIGAGGLIFSNKIPHTSNSIIILWDEASSVDLKGGANINAKVNWQ